MRNKIDSHGGGDKIKKEENKNVKSKKNGGW
jgi:hypothetical protein